MSIDSQASEFTPRQNAVLAEALRLLVEGGDKAVTTAGLARAANCSKESLYKWFGDRDGLLTATVQWQAAKVAAGYATLGDVPAQEVDGTSRLVQLYLRAVYCATAVELHERYRSYDATGQGNQRADDLAPTIDEIRRDLRNAISDLLGTRRVTVELI